MNSEAQASCPELLSASGTMEFTSPAPPPSLLTRLHSLEVSPLRFYLVTGRDFRLPVYKGSVFRGGFGQLFREIACLSRASDCHGCRHLDSCGYSQVFESPILPGQANILTKYPQAPHPFVLSPPLDDRTYLPAGSKLELDITLIQSARRWFPHFIFVFDELGRRGNYGGPYRIDQVTSRIDGRTLFDGAARKIVEDPAAVSWSEEVHPVQRLGLEFVTPLRIRTQGEYNTNPDFVAFVHALLGRLHLLTTIYGGQSESREWMRPLMAQADHVKTEQREFRMFPWDRTSGRQHRRVPMDGVLGRLIAQGNLAPFLPALRAGELLHVGSGTSMGLGKYRVIHEP
jgi:hypothetical protein